MAYPYNNYVNYTTPVSYAPAQMNQPWNWQMSGNNNNNVNQNPQPDMNWVQGEAGAKAYYVPAGHTVPLYDSEQPIIYFKSADMSGRPSMRIADYIFRDQQMSGAQQPIDSTARETTANYATKDDIDQLKEMISNMTRLNEPKQNTASRKGGNQS